MYTKAQVTNAIDALKNQCTDEEQALFEDHTITDESGVTTTVLGIYTVVNSYYSSNITELSKALADAVKCIFSDITRRYLMYENSDKYSYNLPTTFPNGYSDLATLFYDFTEICTVTYADFKSGFYSSVDATTGISSIAGNTYLDTWSNAISSARANEIAGLETISEWWINSGDGNNYLIDLTEEMGELIYSLHFKKIATLIYINRHAYEIIKKIILSTYVPTYIGDNTSPAEVLEFDTQDEFFAYLTKWNKQYKELYPCDIDGLEDFIDNFILSPNAPPLSELEDAYIMSSQPFSRSDTEYDIISPSLADI